MTNHLDVCEYVCELDIDSLEILKFWYSMIYCLIMNYNYHSDYNIWP